MSSNKVLLEGYMKKLKTMKKRYFVLMGDTTSRKGCLKYFDSEKKYKQSVTKREPMNPKRCIVLEECFSINRKYDTKHLNVLGLYMQEECFSIIFETEDELLKWLNTMLLIQVSADGRDDGRISPKKKKGVTTNKRMERKKKCGQRGCGVGKVRSQAGWSTVGLASLSNAISLFCAIQTMDYVYVVVVVFNAVIVVVVLSPLIFILFTFRLRRHRSGLSCSVPCRAVVTVPTNMSV